MNDKLQKIINVANKYGHAVVRVKLDDDSMIYECLGGTPHDTSISDYLEGGCKWIN